MNRTALRPHSTAARKAQAVLELEDLIRNGTKVRTAVEGVAYRTGIAERTLFTYLQKTKGVPPEEREAVLEPKSGPPRKRVSCHPEALKRFVELGRSGRLVTECYRQLLAEAEANGWAPIPSERTLRRELDRQVTWAERFNARRGINPSVEV